MALIILKNRLMRLSQVGTDASLLNPSPEITRQKIPKISRPVRLTLIYLLFGGSWILVTDWVILEIAAQYPSALPIIMNAKGLVFILLSAALLYSVNKADNIALQKYLVENRGLVQRYNALRSASKEAVYEYDIMNDTVQINQFLREIFGFTGEVMPNGWSLWQEKVHPADHDRIKHGMANQLRTGETTWQDEYQLKDWKGRYRNVIHTCYLIKDENNRPYRVIGTLLDISELRNLQKKFYQQEMVNKSAMMQAIVKAQENERDRWAVELHDNIGQLLSVTKLYLGNFSEKQAPDKDMLERTRDIVQLSLSEIRQLSARLKPPVFEDQSLASAIKNLTENINRVRNIHFDIQVETPESLLREEHKLMIYRIIQEQLTNIIKYANPSTVVISVKGEGHPITVRVSDDGIGFDTKQEAVGIGLKNIRSRLQAYKGTMRIQSAPGKGCEIVAEFEISD